MRTGKSKFNWTASSLSVVAAIFGFFLSAPGFAGEPGVSYQKIEGVPGVVVRVQYEGFYKYPEDLQAESLEAATALCSSKLEEVQTDLESRGKTILSVTRCGDASLAHTHLRWAVGNITYFPENY
jgi:hypothetical protein